MIVKFLGILEGYAYRIKRKSENSLKEMLKNAQRLDISKKC